MLLASRESGYGTDKAECLTLQDSTAGGGKVHMQRFRFATIGVLLLALVLPLTAQAQLAVIDPDMIDSLGIEVLAGTMEPATLLDGKTVLVFLYPGECRDCVELLARASTWDELGVRVVLVTSESSSEWGLWEEGPDWNVWRDPDRRMDSVDNLASLLGGSDPAPVVFFIDSGAVLNADYWPFYEGLDGLEREVAAFAGQRTRK